jgi:membrane-bound lytic murein transglycosylase MltF
MGKCRRNIKTFFILGFLFLIQFLVGACKDSGKKVLNGKTNPDTGENKAKQDISTNISTNTSTSALKNRSDSFLISLLRARKIYVGDFDTMMKHHLVRVLVPYSRTLFFNDRGRERGISADNFRDFERFINQKYHKKLHNIPVTVIFIPTPRDQLLPNVMQGIGDIAAGNLTATEERLRLVDFEAPQDLTNVSEIVLTHRIGDSVSDIAQLSGRSIYVRRSSSYYNSLEGLNKILGSKGKPPVAIKTVSEDLEDEDLMEMLGAGIIPAIVVDDWKAKMWAQVLPNMVLNEKAPLRIGGHIGCAYRKNSPLLAAELNDFYYKFEKRNGNMPFRFRMYNRQVRYLQDPTKSANANRYRDIIKLFEKYGGKYDFDPLMLAAMGFQESGLNQKERSPVGAIGVMQIMPGTGAQMKVGDITVTEPNIHAGTKYMNFIMSNNFRDAHFDEFNRSLFAFASYNAGPGKIDRLRKMAAKRGLNPDVWLNNVEIVASEKIGHETTTYVRNIIKYYYSYKLMLERGEKERNQREAF